MKTITGKYCVKNISAEENKVVVNLKLDTAVPSVQDAEWVNKHIKMYGKAPELFWIFCIQ